MWGWAAAVVLGLFLRGPACKAALLGAVVTLEPLQPGEQQVKAHTSILAGVPCPSLKDFACDGTHCTAHVTSAPIRGQYPHPGWCLQQWQSSVPFRHTSHQTLGSTDVILPSYANLAVRPDNQKVNQPPLAALPPPLRVSVDCVQKFNLSVIDLDGDHVRCRYGNAEQRECQSCSRHRFLRLDEASCVLVYDGLGDPGQYLVELMVEDFLSNDVNGGSEALSSTPLKLTMIVEHASAACQALPTFTETTPAGGTQFTVLPYEQLNITVEAYSSSERIEEIAIVGPPGLFVPALKRKGSLASISFGWLRKLKNLPQQLSVCFIANTPSSQSEIRCVWIKQKPMDSLPPGTVVQCGDAAMNFSFPMSSIPGLAVSDLQLNDKSCPIFHNDTHVTGTVSLNGCGTKTVHLGSELIYTNTLQTLPPNSTINRLPTLVLRLSCRFQPSQVSGPHYDMADIKDEEIFGVPNFWMMFYEPGTGPFAGETQEQGPVHEHMLDLHIFSNTTLDRAELQVSSCMQSPTADFKETFPLVQSGCDTRRAALQSITQTNNVKVYRLDLQSLITQDDIMYVECKVQLCIALMPSDRCPTQCRSARTRTAVVPTVYTKIFTVRSGPVRLGNAATATPPTTTQRPTTTMSNAPPEHTGFLILGVAMGVARMLIQTVLL